MNILCGWMAAFALIVGIGFSIDKDSTDYIVEFMLGAMFVIAVWAAITL